MDNQEKTAVRKRPVWLKWSVSIAAALVVLCCCYVLNLKTVVLDVDGSRITVKTISLTVGSLLRGQNIVLLEKDEVSPSLDARLQENMVITINRAADLTIAVDGGEIPVRTMARKVADVLFEYGISLDPEDEVEPAQDSPVSSGMAIKIVRVKTEYLTCDVPVDFEIQKQYTVMLPSDVSRVAQEGRTGMERQDWQVTFKDGKEFMRQLVSRELLESPIDRIVVYGSAQAVSRGGEDIRYSRDLDMLASAYTYTGNNTASGVAPYYGVAAVDTSNIAMGTSLYVDGYGYATALDRGGAIKGNRIDLFFGTHEEAVSWGVRWVKVYVLD